MASAVQTAAHAVRCAACPQRAGCLSIPGRRHGAVQRAGNSMGCSARMSSGSSASEPAELAEEEAAGWWPRRTPLARLNRTPLASLFSQPMWDSVDCGSKPAELAAQEAAGWLPSCAALASLFSQPVLYCVGSLVALRAVQQLAPLMMAAMARISAVKSYLMQQPPVSCAGKEHALQACGLPPAGCIVTHLSALLPAAPCSRPQTTWGHRIAYTERRRCLECSCFLL